jgi:hypothetical protein
MQMLDCNLEPINNARQVIACGIMALTLKSENPTATPEEIYNELAVYFDDPIIYAALKTITEEKK